MRNLTVVLLMLFVCACSTVLADTNGADRVSEKSRGPIPMVVLTAFDVNDHGLTLRCRIMNGSQSDIWVCESIGTPGQLDADANRWDTYMDSDGRTLVVEKRFEIPILQGTRPKVWEARYVRLRPGQERASCLSIALPAQHLTLRKFDYTQDAPAPDAPYATRLAVNIGFYGGDVFDRVRSVLNVADKLNLGKPLAVDDLGTANFDTYLSYFSGFRIANAFGGLSGFNDRWNPMSEWVAIPYLWPASLDERCLKLEIDGVFIPYDSGRPRT